MSAKKTLTFYLDDSMRERAEAGKTNIINRISNAFQDCGFQCRYRENSAVNLLGSVRDPGYSLFHMDEPFHPRSLSLRRAYYYPFWRIEASDKRWNWRVAKAKFDPPEIDHNAAGQFRNYWKKQLFGGDISAMDAIGSVYIPLQGRLTEMRSFQAKSPISMVKSVLRFDAGRNIVITLHPRESYSQQELDELNALIEHEPRLVLATSNISGILQSCDYVVSQNSSVVLDGYFFEKPAILFGKIDFHHIAENVLTLGEKAAYSKVLRERNDFSTYIYWFLQLQSINAGREDAEENILVCVRAHGWSV